MQCNVMYVCMYVYMYVYTIHIYVYSYIILHVFHIEIHLFFSATSFRLWARRTAATARRREAPDRGCWEEAGSSGSRAKQVHCGLW